MFRKDRFCPLKLLHPIIQQGVSEHNEDVTFDRSQLISSVVSQHLNNKVQKQSHSPPCKGHTTKLRPHTLRITAMWVNFVVSRFSEFNLTAALDIDMCVQVSELAIEPQAQPRAEEKKKKTHAHERTCT